MSVAVPVIDSWNGETRRIYLKMGVTSFHWITDIYHEYRNWRRTVEGARLWAPLMRAAGNDPKGGGKYTPRFVTLLEGTRVVPYDENILIEVTGEAITDNADIDPDPFDTSTRTQPLKLYITPPASELVRAEAEIAAVNRMSYNEGGTIDPINGYVPADNVPNLGNQQYPCKYLSDVLVVAAANGFKLIFIKGNLTLGATDNVAGYTLVGEDASSTILTLTAGCNTTAAHLRDLTVTGTCGGRMDMTNCHLTNIVGLCASGGDANLKNCKLMNSIQLNAAADQTFNFDQCIGSGGATAPTIDVNGCAADIDFSCYSGSMTLQNCTNTAVNISIDINTGYVSLASSVTQGNIMLRGTAKYTNNTTAQAGLTLDTSGLQIPAIDQYGQRIYVDVVSGQAGSDYPRGLIGTPVNNIPDALLLAAKFFCHELHFHSDATIAAGLSLSHTILSAHTSFSHTITFEAGCTTENLIFKDLKITGTLNGKCTFENCFLDTVTDLYGYASGGLMNGTITLKAGQKAAFHNLRSAEQTPVTINVGTAEVNAVDLFGMFTLAGKTGLGEFNAHFGYGVVIIDASCTAGTIYLAGHGMVMGSSGGSTVMDQMANFADMQDEQFGKWALDPDTDTLTMYKRDGVTVLKQFSLTEATGTVPPYIERTPV